MFFSPGKIAYRWKSFQVPSRAISLCEPFVCQTFEEFPPHGAMESPGEATTRGRATSEGSRGRRENVTLNAAFFSDFFLSQLNGWFHGKIWVEININLFSRRKPAMIRFCFDPRCSVFPKTCGGTTSPRRRGRTPTIGRRKDSGFRVFAVDVSKCIERLLYK